LQSVWPRLNRTNDANTITDRKSFLRSTQLPRRHTPPSESGDAALPRWYDQDAVDVLHALETRASGLTRDEAARRLERDGSNALAAAVVQALLLLIGAVPLLAMELVKAIRRRRHDRAEQAPRRRKSARHRSPRS
jgi:hypothetical protein